MPALPPAAETGQLGLPCLHQYWQQAMARRQGQLVARTPETWRLDNILLNGLDLALEETTQFLFQHAPTFAEFERWILARHGGHLDPLRLERLRCLFGGQPYGPALQAQLREIEESPDVLSPADLRHWHEHGYVIVPNAIPQEQARATEAAVWEHLGMHPHDPTTWYQRPIGKGIMMEFYHHPTLLANRQAPRIRKAFAQLWGTPDLWPTTDRTSFNPPETTDLPFQGPHLHWDMSLEPPFRFGTQGLLYLCDTPAHQGAFCCVPGFQHRLQPWLAALPPGTDPYSIDLQPQAHPIAAQAGDFVIWHHFLPHGSSPNHGTYPRIVQYINMYPATLGEAVE
jgi:hypothetical protein